MKSNWSHTSSSTPVPDHGGLTQLDNFLFLLYNYYHLNLGAYYQLLFPAFQHKLFNVFDKQSNNVIKYTIILPAVIAYSIYYII